MVVLWGCVKFWGFRVKVAIARKDEMLEEMSRDQKALQEKCVYLESMLEQQRKEFFIK